MSQLLLWAYPSPASEARYCIGIARRNGGVDAMRKTIAVSPQDEKNLHRMANEGFLTMFQVERALAFRAAVLHEFDALTARSEP